MERYIKAQDLLDGFERGLNPLPNVEQDAVFLVRLAGADQARLEPTSTGTLSPRGGSDRDKRDVEQSR
jgi:hypothetical protein